MCPERFGAAHQLFPGSPQRVARLDVVVETCGYDRVSVWGPCHCRKMNSDQAVLLVQRALEFPINVLAPVRVRSAKNDCARRSADVVVSNRLHDVLGIEAVVGVSQRIILNDVVRRSTSPRTRRNKPDRFDGDS